MPQITQLFPTLDSVITLGHSPNVPLMGLPSELGYGLEPHDMFYLGSTASGSVRTGHRVRGGGVPGVGQWVGTWRGIPGT